MSLCFTTSHIFLVYFLVVRTSFVPMTTTALMFNIAGIGPTNHNDIVTEGNGTSISTDGLHLAMSTSRSGRATYVEPLHLWDAGSGWLADFTTVFSFVMNSLGDGLSFFLARNSSLVVANGAMGLPVVNGNASSPFVALEFDTRWNPIWDPFNGSNHVGIDINSLASVMAEKWWSNATDDDGDKEIVVKIRYNSATQNLSFTFTDFLQNNPIHLHYIVDLRRVLPEWVVFGFGASSSGDGFNRNSIKSWFFNSSELQVDQKKKRRKKKPKNLRIILIFVGIVIGALVCGAGFMKLVLCVFTKTSEPGSFKFQQLSTATNNFDLQRKLGEGGSGVVYEGVLPIGGMGMRVAVKRLRNASPQEMKAYETEVRTGSQLRQRHLVQLIGWCNDKRGEFLIVYELMENRSLDRHLFHPEEEPLLPWGMRYKIAQGLAKALRYLHGDSMQCVLHRDIKSANVMLDSEFNAKLGDFGLAKHVDHGVSTLVSAVAGTFGYMAPEYFNTRIFTPKSDVYSYGMVALEIATGKRATDQVDSECLLYWVRRLSDGKAITQAADQRLDNEYDQVQMEGLLLVGLWCTLDEARLRPSMEEVVGALDRRPQDLISYIQRNLPTSFSNPRPSLFLYLKSRIKSIWKWPAPTHSVVVRSETAA